MWYYKHIGGERCPIVDTWWQTETGGIMITSLPGITTMRPGSATHPFPGIQAEILDDRGEVIPTGSGYLAVTRPWPGMLRTIWGDEQRYIDTYWSRWPGKPYYFPGDGAKRDADGNFMVIGRVDDVINISGHRIGTMEVESALVDHPSVAEAACVGRAHEIKGTAIVAFVTLKEGQEQTPKLLERLREHVANKIGAIAKPDSIIWTADLPKTRSGKIMRRLLKDIADGRALGDTTTLADPNVVAMLQRRYSED
jgi:acetyl-CoA synthetase